MTTDAFARLQAYGRPAARFAEFLTNRYPEPVAALEFVSQSKSNKPYKALVLTNRSLEYATCDLPENNELQVKVKSFPIRHIKELAEEFSLPAEGGAAGIGRVKIFAHTEEITVSLAFNVHEKENAERDLNFLLAELRRKFDGPV